MEVKYPWIAVILTYRTMSVMKGIGTVSTYQARCAPARQNLGQGRPQVHAVGCPICVWLYMSSFNIWVTYLPPKARIQAPHERDRLIDHTQFLVLSKFVRSQSKASGMQLTCAQ